MKKSILTVTLNPALDRTIVVKNFHPNETFFKQDEYVSAGGKGLNVSRALKRLGINSFATGLLGGDAGKTIKRLLKEEGITSGFLEVDGNTRVNLTVLDSAQVYKRTRILDLGPGIKKQDIVSFKKRFKGFLRFSNFVVLSGRNPKGAYSGLYYELIMSAKKVGAPVILDTSGPALSKGIRAKPLIVKPNKEELEELVGRDLNSFKAIKESILKLHKKGIKIVLLTLGNKGAIGSYDGEMCFVNCPKVKAVNDVGCGDSFIAGFLSFYLKKQKFNHCLRNAVAAGTANSISFTPGSISLGKIAEVSKSVILKTV